MICRAIVWVKSKRNCCANATQNYTADGWSKPYQLSLLERRLIMKRSLWGIVCACLIAGCSQQSAPEPSAPALVSGLDTQYFDDTARPQDDLYQHVNGKWLAITEIPPDKGRYDQFNT